MTLRYLRVGEMKSSIDASNDPSFKDDKSEMT